MWVAAPTTAVTPKAFQVTNWLMRKTLPNLERLNGQEEGGSASAAPPSSLI